MRVRQRERERESYNDRRSRIPFRAPPLHSADNRADTYFLGFFIFIIIHFFFFLLILFARVKTKRVYRRQSTRISPGDGAANDRGGSPIGRRIATNSPPRHAHISRHGTIARHRFTDTAGVAPNENKETKKTHLYRP